MKYSHGLKFKKGVYYFSEKLGGWTDDVLNYPPPEFDSEQESIDFIKLKQKELVECLQYS